VDHRAARRQRSLCARASGGPTGTRTGCCRARATDHRRRNTSYRREVPGRIERFLVDWAITSRTGSARGARQPDYRAQAGGRRRSSARRRQPPVAESTRGAHQPASFGKGWPRAKSRPGREPSRGREARVAQRRTRSCKRAPTSTTRRLRRRVRASCSPSSKEWARCRPRAASPELGRHAAASGLEELRAELDVSETDLGDVHMGQDAEVVTDAYPRLRTGRRSYQAVSADQPPEGPLKSRSQSRSPTRICCQNERQRDASSPRRPRAREGGSAGGDVSRAAMRPWTQTAPSVGRRRRALGAQAPGSRRPRAGGGEEVPVTRGW